MSLGGKPPKIALYNEFQTDGPICAPYASTYMIWHTRSGAAWFSFLPGFWKKNNASRHCRPRRGSALCEADDDAVAGIDNDTTFNYQSLCADEPNGYVTWSPDPISPANTDRTDNIKTQRARPLSEETSHVDRILEDSVDLQSTSLSRPRVGSELEVFALPRLSPRTLVIEILIVPSLASFSYTFRT
ncbi:hypothetical protein VTN00DRAFT_7429 [Thermoascus crustaceus]|uniref:uncharacterized protein n=1 Tax=Thermoascus crustaceus TaxID=5088 RepID=UPI003743B3F5